MPIHIDENPSPRWRCPSCENEIDHVNYNCDIYGSASGNCNIEINGEFGDTEQEDHQFDDSDHYIYICPECGEEIDSVERIDGDEESETSQAIPTPTIINEDNQTIDDDIIDPKVKKLISKNTPNNLRQINRSIIFCPNCKKPNTNLRTTTKIIRETHGGYVKEAQTEEELACEYCGQDINLPK